VSGTEVAVATLAQVPDGCMKAVSAGGVAIVLYNVGGELYASTDACPHQGSPLSAGELVDGVVMCPFHAWEFDVRTGECVSLPEARPLRRLPVRVVGDVIRVVVAARAADDGDSAERI
jgi:nitrite reductase/ring-hydroxylating ferredoxin subunit